jgi:DNA-binding transcriptional LysR family regulator
MAVMEADQLNLRHLRAISEIAGLGTMRAAAEAVSLTQPAITQALRRTEEQLGLPLFERRYDGMVPTVAADILVPRFRAALAFVDTPHTTMARMRALVAFSDSGSLSAAAQRTGHSSPSLHRAIRDLSLSMRKQLVGRRGKHLVLTEVGIELVRSFRLALVELEAGLSEIDALKGIETRKISVGAMPLSRARVLPSAVTRFLRKYPKVKISIIESSRNELVEPLRNGAIDLIVGALREPLLEPDLLQFPLFSDRPRIVGRKGHPLGGTEPLLADLARFQWIIAAIGAPLRDLWEKMFREASLPIPTVPVELGSVMTIRQLLIDSDFLTLLSPDQIAVEIEAGWLEIIGDMPAATERSIGITTRASWRPTTVQSEFFADLEAVSREAEGAD